MHSARLERPLCCRVEAACNLHAVTDARRQVKQFLDESGVAAEELGAWELALAEASNNAVLYVGEAGRAQPVCLEASVGEQQVEVRITDHTPGFDLPEVVELPDPLSESGRGLFMIKSLTDEASYLRSPRENCFVLRKRRQALPPGKSLPPNLEQELADTRQTLDLMTAELASSYESLATIFHFSSDLHTGARSEELARRWLVQLLSVTESDWFVLRLCDAERRQLRVLASSSDHWHGAPLPLPTLEAAIASVELQAATRRMDVAFDSKSPLPAADPLAAFGQGSCGFVHPVLVNDMLVGVLTIGRLDGESVFEAGQVSVIQTFADFLGIHVRNEQFLEEQARSRLVARDLEIAATIQRSLLPENLPALPGVTLAGFYRSARQVGGDYYDALPTPDGDLLLVVADVMGKGLPSALFAFMLRSLVRSRLDLASRPGEFLAWLNHNLFAELDRAEMFITVQIAFLDRLRGEVRVSAAGHPPLLAAGPDGEVREVLAGGAPLGIRAAEVFPEERLSSRGFRTLMFTDGLIEARSPAGELLGLDSVKAVLSASARAGESPDATQQRLVTLVRAFEADSAPSDDTAFLILAHASHA